MRKHIAIDLVWTETLPNMIEVHYNGAHKYNLALDENSQVTFNIEFGAKAPTQVTIKTGAENGLIVPPGIREIQL